MPSPSITELAVASGLDWVAIDAEHGSFDWATIERHIRATVRGYGNTIEDSVYVAPEAQGHGIGRALLAALIERCTADGFRQMIAVIGDTGNTASIRLHQSLGFAPVGTFSAVGWKHGRWLDSVLMQRPLGLARRSRRPADCWPARRAEASRPSSARSRAVDRP